jgi:phenylacetate-CoA ligase
MGHRITVITPGIDVDENIRILRELSPGFEQSLLFGYPPLVRDIVTGAITGGIDFQRSAVRLIMAGESITEDWRNHIEQGLHTPEDSLGSLLIYGTADAGIVGFESPASRYIRKHASCTPALRNSLFPGAVHLPTLVEFDPAIRWIEEVDGKVVFTAFNSLPLIRYAIGDYGRVIDADAVLDAFRNVGLAPPLVRRPFVAVYGRPDVAASFYSLNIYPENVRPALEAHDVVGLVTGKFVVSTQQPELDRPPYLQVKVELAAGFIADAALVERVCQRVVESLLATNSEYRRLHAELGTDAEPVIVLSPWASPEFAVTAKHRWIQ